MLFFVHIFELLLDILRDVACFLCLISENILQLLDRHRHLLLVVGTGPGVVRDFMDRDCASPRLGVRPDGQLGILAENCILRLVVRRTERSDHRFIDKRAILEKFLCLHIVGKRVRHANLHLVPLWLD